MIDEKIKVICYSGYRAEERPEAFIFHGEKVEIAAVLNMSIEENIRERRRRRVLKVRGTDGYEYKIYYDEVKSEWFLTK
jgi:hypothetical protein